MSLAVYKVIKRTEMERVDQNKNINNINILNTIKQSNEYVAIASLDKIELIATAEITLCQADGKYTNFFLVNGSKIMSSRNLEIIPLFCITVFFLEYIIPI